jgi:aspartate carbamoyltransferase catalytic subunit
MLLRSIADFSQDDIDRLLHRAAAHQAGQLPRRSPDGVVIGLAFFETSLRTRVGFAAAAARLGATPVEVHEVRASAVSMAESVDDTIRTLAGYADVVVARVDQPLVTLPVGVGVPVLNGGDRGERAEHPSQALIDLYAISRLGRPIDELTIALCGDLRMRAVRSLLIALSLRPPKLLWLITEPPLRAGFTLPNQLAASVEYVEPADVADADVLYVAGIPHGALTEDARTRLRVTNRLLDRMRPNAVVLSPLPIIDEMEREAFRNPRVRMFEQSDDALFVRMAVLEFLLAKRTNERTVV